MGNSTINKRVWWGTYQSKRFETPCEYLIYDSASVIGTS